MVHSYPQSRDSPAPSHSGGEPVPQHGSPGRGIIRQTQYLQTFFIYSIVQLPPTPGESLSRNAGVWGGARSPESPSPRGSPGIGQLSRKSVPLRESGEGLDLQKAHPSAIPGRVPVPQHGSPGRGIIRQTQYLQTFFIYSIVQLPPTPGGGGGGAESSIPQKSSPSGEGWGGAESSIPRKFNSSRESGWGHDQNHPNT